MLFSRVLAMGIVMTCMAADMPPVPQANNVLPAWRAINSQADIGRLFVPGAETPQAVWSESGCVTLPVNFTAAHHGRVFWDAKLALDLRLAKGIQFDFFCQNIAAISSFSLYFRSGKGWYHGTFMPDREGAWQRIVIDKSEIKKAEGVVTGWGQIDAVRIAGWRQRDQDTVCAIANLAFSGGPPVALVVCADSQASKGGSEAKAFSQYASTITATLDNLGVANVQTSDLDLTPEMLKGIKLVVLPYNPALPETTAACLKSFVAAGGKLMACYSLAKETSDLIGVNYAGALVPEGGFSGFARTERGLRSQPPFAPQGSGRTTLVVPTHPDNAQVAAVWRDRQGNNTQHPAITLTPTGAFIGHVWVGGPDASTTQLMRALLGELVPGFWRQTAEAALTRIGTFADLRGLDDLRRALDARGVRRCAKDEFAKATRLRDEAREQLQNNEWDKSFEISGQAADAAVRAWMMTRESRCDEHRAFWCHSAFGLRGKDWDTSIRFLAENGFNVIQPNMLWAGVTYYPSAVLPVYEDLATQGDQMQQCLTACRKYGVQCHVWKVNWNMSSRVPAAFVERMTAEGRVQRSRDGESRKNWLCPSHPANQDLEVDSLLELARNYPIDGIHFDYIRYPDQSFCFCDGCRARFSQKIGKEFAQWPDDLQADKKAWQAWLAFRRSHIDTVVRRVSEGARRIRPDIQISAAVFRNWSSDRDVVGQDWGMWCEQGWLDFVCPMNYCDSNTTFRNMITAQKEYIKKARLYPGIGLSCWQNPRDPIKLAEQIQIARDAGLSGFTVFNYDACAEAVLPFIRLGVTADPGWRFHLWPFK